MESSELDLIKAIDNVLNTHGDSSYHSYYSNLLDNEYLCKIIILKVLLQKLKDKKHDNDIKPLYKKLKKAVKKYIKKVGLEEWESILIQFLSDNNKFKENNEQFIKSKDKDKLQQR